MSQTIVATKQVVLYNAFSRNIPPSSQPMSAIERNYLQTDARGDISSRVQNGLILGSVPVGAALCRYGLGMTEELLDVI